MLDPLADGKGADAREVDADIKLGVSDIFDGMWIDSVGFKATCDYDEFIVHCDNFLAGLALSVQLDDFLLELQ